MTGSHKPAPVQCFDTMLTLRGRRFDLSPGDRWQRAVSTVLRGAQGVRVPWSYVMPRRDHTAFVKNIINSANEAIDELTLDYLATSWADGARVLGRLERACIDGQLVERLHTQEQSESVKSALASFAPLADGRAAPIVYDRLTTATGRPTVVSGPQILTVRKDLRRVITSAHGAKGVIVILDFAALEARVVLHGAGRSCTEPDLYGAIAYEQFDGRVARSAVKTCVLSLLFGAGRASTAERLGSDGPEVDTFIARISEYFGFGRLGAALTQLRSEQGVLRNAYGRPLLLDGHETVSDSLLLSHFVQSTGVDVSLMGFSRITDRLANEAPRVRPLFVLHDALFLDVPLSDLERVERVRDVKVPGYDVAFPLKAEVLMRCDE